MNRRRHTLLEVKGGTCTKNFQESMLKVIDKKFKKYLKVNDENRELIIAAVSSPYVKLDFIENSDDCDVARNFLINECIRLSPNEMSESEFESTPDNGTPGRFVSFANRRMSRRKSSEQYIVDEIDRYLDDNRTDSKMLNDYSHVREVYVKFNTTLSSSAVVERVFSQSSLIFTPRRNRISSTNFEYALLLKYNRKLSS